MGARIVLDTNILVSALGWRGAPHETVRLCLEGQHQLLLSPDILNELERVLAYPKLDFSPSAILEYLELLTEAAEIVQPDFRLNVIEEDPSDNRILECALAGRADVVVTGDSHLLTLGSFEGVFITTAPGFLADYARAQ